MADRPKPKRNPHRKRPLASAGLTPDERVDAVALLRASHRAVTLTIGTFAVVIAYLIFDRLADNSTVLNSPILGYAFPVMAVSIILIVYRKLLRKGPQAPLARIALISKAILGAAVFVVLLCVTSILFTKVFSTSIQTPLFIVGMLVVLTAISAVAGGLAFETLKGRPARD